MNERIKNLLVCSKRSQRDLKMPAKSALSVEYIDCISAEG